MWHEVGEKAEFLWQFVRDPRSIGAVAPSSRFLAEAMVGESRIDEAAVVVEYGPGTGAFTALIRERMRPGARYLAIERNLSCASRFSSRFPDAELVTDSVDNVERICERRRIPAIDVVISGLPWAAFSVEQQQKALDPLVRILAPDGRFATFAYLQGLYLPPGRRFRSELDRRFASIRRSSVVWRNLPPAIVYRCSKPLR